MPRTSCRDSLSNGLGPLDSELGVLFLAAFPLILMFFEGSAASAFAAVLQLALLLAALCLIHRGQKRQNEYDAAEAARATEAVVAADPGAKKVCLWPKALFACGCWVGGRGSNRPIDVVRARITRI